MQVPYFNTFAGNPVSMAAAAAVLDVIEDEDLMANAADGRCCAARRGCRRIVDDHPRLGDVRGAGLYIGVEVVSDAEAKTPDRADARRLVNAHAGKAGADLGLRP